MKAVILAGGLGTRLKPFTDVIPKPLMPFGEKSLLELQIEHLRDFGFNDISLALGHKPEYVKSFLGDGTRLGVDIHYSIEDKPLGTCGPITRIREHLTEPFLLMNGDILTKANFREIFDFALSTEEVITVVTKIITTPFRFGSIISEGHRILKIEEKPNLKFEILSGIYIMKPEIFDYIPSNEYFGIDNLLQGLLSNNIPIARYLLKEYWIDIGMVEDYEKAREVYNEHFRK